MSENDLAAAVILDFRPRLGNRCRVFPVYTLLRASILDFRLRLENRCRVSRDYALLRASILDFKLRLGNRCSDFDAAAKNSPPAAQWWGAGRDRVPRRRHNPK